MPAVIFFVSVGGVDITSKLVSRLVEMTVTDGVGSKSDTLQLVLDDKDGSIAAPRRGVKITAVGGYEGNARSFGEFVVDNISYEGWPQKITINAQSVDAKGDGKKRDPKAYPSKGYDTYGDIMSDVAARVGVTLSMSNELRALKNHYEAQGEETVLEFATRIGEKIGASVTVKSGRLLVLKSGAGKTASGNAIPTLAIAPGLNLLSYQVSEEDQPSYGKAEASYYDRKKNKRVTVSEGTGLDGPSFLIKAPLATEEDAKKAAKAKAADLVRAQASATFSIDGTPNARAEAHVSVSGCRPQVDGVWRVTTATHKFSASGPYTTELQCERPSS